MRKKILITVGGTGGHVFPAISLAQQIKAKCPDVDLLFVGGNLAGNRFFDKEAFPHQTISAGTFSIRNPLKLIKGMGRIAKGTWESKKIINNFNPDLVVGFGSYYTLPTLLAAQWAGIPFVLHESNSIPGKVNRLLSPYALVTGVQFPSTSSLLKGKSVVVETPLREGFRLGTVTKETARKYFDLEPNRTTILVFGGSQGAKAINSLIGDALTNYLQTHSPFIQILHFTGSDELTEKLSQQYKDFGFKACVKTFESRMELAWQAASLLVSRSGSGTIAEELEFEVPGILIPFPFATEGHQEINADFMVQQVGGAVKCLEGDLTTQKLSEEIENFLANEKRLLKSMTAAIQIYKGKNKTIDLYSLIQGQLYG